MKETTFHLREHLLFALLTVLTLILCIGVGSVSVPFRDTAEIIFRAIAGWEQPSGSAVAIILYTRLPRVLCVALVGAMLALGGCAMQGLLRNPLADGSTLGVSSGASLGAALAILSGVSIPFLPFDGTAGAAMLSAFLSLVVLLALAFALDHSLATNTLILLGVVFSMFVSALLSLLITFSGDKLRAITFWTMGNLSSASYQNALTLLATLLLCGGIILTQARALNAMSMGEAYALLKQVSLSGKANRLAGQLSHGEQRSLEVALALATKPKLLLLDEPMAGMGTEESERMVELIEHLAQQVTILLVEHDMAAVFRLADRISVLVGGVVIASGSPEAIRADAEVRRAYLGEEAT